MYPEEPFSNGVVCLDLKLTLLKCVITVMFNNWNV